MSTQETRQKDINAILRLYQEPDVPDNIIKHIKKKYPKLKHYDYVHSEQINENDLIQMVSLDMKKISIVGKCVKINYNQNKTIENILLANNLLNIYWRINPTKYYVFKVISKDDVHMKELIENIYRKNLKKK
jgi:hypothetical protein